MKKATTCIIAILLVLVLPLYIYAEASDNGIRKFESSAALTSINIAQNWEVEFNQTSGKTTVTVEVPHRFIDYVNIYISKESLHIVLDYPKEAPVNAGEKFLAKISSPSIFNFNIGGSCKFIVQGNFKNDKAFALNAMINSTFKCGNISSPEIYFNMAGNNIANVEELDCDFLDVRINGSALLKVNGDVRTKQDLKLSTAINSNFSCGNILCHNLEIGTSGSSNININTIDCNAIKAFTAGASNLTVQGDVKSRADFTLLSSIGSHVVCDNVSCNNLEIGASGTSKVNTGTVDCSAFRANIGGGARLNISGDIKAMQDVQFENFIGGNIECENIYCKNAELSANGKSSITTAGITCNNIIANLTGGAAMNADKVKAETISLTTFISSDASVKSTQATNIEMCANDSSQITLKDILAKVVLAQTGGGAKINLSGQADAVDFLANLSSKITATELKANKGRAKIYDLSSIHCSVKELTKIDEKGTNGIVNY